MEYSLEFSKRLLTAGQKVVEFEKGLQESDRAVLYLSQLSIEISLKYLLEKAGVPINQIKKKSHNLKNLLDRVDQCSVEIEVGENVRRLPASRLRSKPVDQQFGNVTVGTLLQAETKVEVSKYPTEIRYGKAPHHYPAEVMLACAKAIINWAENEGSTIKQDGVTR